VDPEGGTCPRCGTPYDRYQEYCLDCGLRLPLSQGVVGRLHAAWTRRLRWYPGDWVWPALLFLGLAALGATLAIVWARDEPATQRVIATTDIGTDLATVPIQTVETVTQPATTAPVTTTRTAPSATVPERPPPGALRQWPANRNGYTVVLVSLPSRGGREAATARAREASRAGLRDVGVIDSGSFSSLHPGYYVVFAGIYATQGEAEEAISAARSAGFGGAYPRQITR
jgi:SPOR domain